MIPSFIPGRGKITIPDILTELVRLAKSRGWSKADLTVRLHDLWDQKPKQDKLSFLRPAKRVELDADL